MASPPFNIAETVPADTDIVSQYPAAERSFRDVTESWIKVEHNVQGRHDKVSMDDQVSDLSGIDNVIRLYNKAGKLYTISGSAGTPKELPLDVSLLAPKADPVFTGDPKAPTAAATDNDTSIATTAMVQAMATLRGAGKGGYANLKLSSNVSNPGTQIDYSADEISVRVPSGFGYTKPSWSGIINAANTGANGIDAGSLANSTRYAILAIYNPTTDAKAMMLVAEANLGSPTLPSGYTACARYGWVITNTSGSIRPFFQWNDNYTWTGPAAEGNVFWVLQGSSINTFNGTSPSGTTTTRVRGSTAPLPPSAATVRMNVTNQYKSGGTANMLIAPNTSWSGTNKGPGATATANAWPIYLQSGLGVNLGVEMSLESDNILIISENFGGVQVTGYKDTI